jgi:hypothetical protein
MRCDSEKLPDSRAYFEGELRRQMHKLNGVFGSRIGLWIGWICMIAILNSSVGCRLSNEQALRRAASIASIGNSGGVHVKHVKKYDVLGPVSQVFSGPALPSERTTRLLRNFDLDERLKTNPDDVIDWLRELVKQSPRMEEIHALAEVAKIQADWAQRCGDHERAAQLYATALIHSHQFLFDSKLDLKRNAYDPQFRSICDVYNESLGGLLRKLCQEDKIHKGEVIPIAESDSGIEMTIKIEGRLKDEEFERFELVSDYETEGIENQYHTYGLGVPLIAARTPREVNNPEEKYYPPNLTLPMTAFCEIVANSNEFDENGNRNRRKAVLRLFDPLEHQFVKNQSMTVPLESDITTPLAYHLDDPLLSTGVLATASLFNSAAADEIYGMYMLEPYDPTKIPVVMVHGLWSNPVTWTRMFNDLRADSELHKNYQFWFYHYPTGQPFWISAQEMRQELAQIRRELDPGSDSPALDQMVLIGHSMGGLVSQLQIINSGKQFWSLVSSNDFDQLQGDQEEIEAARKVFFFEANQGIDRVVMIGTPNHGSEFASAAVRWASHKVFTLPKTVTNEFRRLVRDNPGVIDNSTMLTTTTSIDSLAPKAPVFQFMDGAVRSKKVKHHSIIGTIPRNSLFGRNGVRPPSRGDGVVSHASSRSQYAISEVSVPAEHSEIHQHPKCILEVRKILMENLVEKNRIRSRAIPALPVSYEQPVKEGSAVSQAWFRSESEDGN